MFVFLFFFVGESDVVVVLFFVIGVWVCVFVGLLIYYWLVFGYVLAV